MAALVENLAKNQRHVGPIPIPVASMEELESVTAMAVEEGAVYSLSVKVPLTQAAFSALAASNLGQNLEEINISPEYNDRSPPIIDTSEVKFPKLKNFELMCQAIKAIHFTADCFPLLEHISIEQPCAVQAKAFHTDLPNLRHMFLEHIHIKDVSDFGPSLSRSPKLNSYFGYKVWGLGAKLEHALVLPNATTLDFYRSDDLRRLKLWAPRLEDLGLQACYSIERVTLLQRKPAKFKGPEYEFKGEPSSFKVNCVNADVPGGNMVTSTRCRKVVEEFDDLFSLDGSEFDGSEFDDIRECLAECLDGSDEELK